MQKIKVKVHELNRLRKGRGRVKTSPSARLVNYRNAGSSQPHLLSQNFIVRILREQWKNKSGRRSFILGGRKASGHGPGRAWRQAAVSGVLHVSAICACSARQGMYGCLPKCQSPVLTQAGFRRGSDRQIQESDFLCMNAEPTEDVTFCCALAAAGVNVNE